MFAEVLIKAKYEAALTYSVPPELYSRTNIGTLVLVPFGNSQKFGIISKLIKKRPDLKQKIKPIQKTLAVNWITPTTIKLATTINKSTNCPLNTILFKLSPTPLKRINLQLLPGASSGKNDKYVIYSSPQQRFSAYQKIISKAVLSNYQAIIICPNVYFSQINQHLQHQAQVIDAKLSPTAQLKAMTDFRNGKIKIIIGSRKILGWHGKNLGLVIVDDPGNIAHKDEQMPYLDTATVIWKRSEIEKFSLIFGSSMPTLGLLAREKNSSIKRINSNATKNLISLVKLKNKLINDTTLKKIGSNKTLIVAPRADFGGTIRCLECDWTLICPKCSSTVNTKEFEQTFACMSCMFSAKSPTSCKNCKSSNIKSYGIGVEAILKELKQFKRISNLKVGTEKDLHHNYELIVWSFADSPLLNPKLERPLEYLAKIKEFAGHTETIIQTLDLESIYWKILANERYLHQILLKRAQKNLPPFKRLIKIELKSTQQSKLLEIFKQIEDLQVINQDLIADHAIIEILIESTQLNLLVSELSMHKGITIKLDSVINYCHRSKIRRVNAHHTHYRSLHSN